jgi:hypothetical protein
MQRHILTIAARATIVVASIAGISGCNDDEPDQSFTPYDVPNSVAVIDMNGDSVPDIVFAATHIDGTYPNPGFAGVILQNSAALGTFQTSTTTAIGTNPSTLAVGNLDSASGPDIVVSNATSANVSVLMHDLTISNGQLQPASTVATGGVPYDVAVGDLNNDGLPDIAMADASSSLNVVLLMRNHARSRLSIHGGCHRRSQRRRPARSGSGQCRSGRRGTSVDLFPKPSNSRYVLASRGLSRWHRSTLREDRRP